MPVHLYGSTLSFEPHAIDAVGTYQYKLIYYYNGVEQPLSSTVLVPDLMFTVEEVPIPEPEDPEPEPEEPEPEPEEPEPEPEQPIEILPEDLPIHEE